MRPTVVTVDKGGKEKKWGPLSRTVAWKAGGYWEESKGDAKVFLEKGGEKKEMSAEKLVGKGGPRFWFKEKPDQPQQEPEERKDDHPVTEETVEESGTEEAGGESVTEDDPVTEDPVQVMSEDDSKERETAHQMWLSEKVTSLETENRELKKALQEMETRFTLQEAAS